MSKLTNIISGTSQVKPSSDRLSTVLQLAELLNESGSQVQSDPLAQESKSEFTNLYYF